MTAEEIAAIYNELLKDVPVGTPPEQFQDLLEPLRERVAEVEEVEGAQ